MVTVFLVRHADIDMPPESTDPPLNEAGRQRAKDLAHVAGSAGITALVTSALLRTKQTVEPLASMLEIEAESASDMPALIEKVRSGSSGSAVLIAGHSNTVPEVIAGLGVSEAVMIDEHDFDNLFVVLIEQAGKSTLLRLKYGSASKPM
jgi:phosphohistidine phosphatase SixA